MKIVTVSCIVVLMGLLVIPTACTAAQSSSAPGSASYEISLGELDKVKKDRPVKKGKKGHKKKKSVPATGQPSIEVTATPEKNDQVSAPALVVPNRSIPTEPPHQPISDKAVGSVSGSKVSPRISGGAVIITHDPYSYVVTGKRTTVRAVISSADSIASVFCRFRSDENGAYARVPMLLVPGTHFTYAAILPSLSSTSRTLLYNIFTVDSSGAETRSQEFTIAVTSSAVMPGWQQDVSAEKIKIRLEKAEVPLEGFSDPGITDWPESR